MNPRLRRVEKLRLRSTDEGLNRRGVILIEDALNTASLPDGDRARVLIIRKLSLGRIRATDAAASIAVRLEARCREVATFAVHAFSPEALAAPAVYFNDDAEPYTRLAIQIACALPVSAWFWPLAVPEWRPTMSRDESMRALLTGALTSSAGPTAALALVRALVRHHALDALASALRHQDGTPLLRAFGWATFGRNLFLLPSTESQRPVDAPSETLESLALPWFIAWGLNDPRSLWLACALYSIERPALTAHASLPPKAAAWIVSSRASVPDVAPLLSEPVEAKQRKASVGQDDVITPSGAPRRHRFTERAGLFYMVTVMHQLGMAEWLETNPEPSSWNTPHRVLHSIAQRLDTRPDDPVFEALGDVSEHAPIDVESDIGKWVSSLRRFCRRTVGMGLHSAVCRRGRLALTETHVDVLFDLDRLDIRIRRTGLDLDPGWVPWFGRVVLFHYGDMEVADA
jgi:hypothetical protein